MGELEKALSEIQAVRSQIARDTQFRGYGPMALAASGLLAIVAALVQPLIVADPMTDLAGYLTLWIATAALSTLLIAMDVLTRSRRVHVGLANEMVQAAAEHLLPSLVTGALLTFVIVRFAPQGIVLLPGLWQIVLSLGIFATCRLLPAPFMAVGVWYLVTGLICIAMADDAALSPWMMGLPFAIGQLMSAGLVWRFGARDGED